ncbi:MAG: hypothetical protein K6253_01265 [Candidatus Liberibacter asiaticus]|nr:hypothetical protein [Candidatus Liberibacter asiaticus]
MFSQVFLLLLLLLLLLFPFPFAFMFNSSKKILFSSNRKLYFYPILMKFHLRR